MLRACIDLRVIHSSGKAPRLTPAHFIAEQGLNAQKLQLDGWMYDVYFKVWIVDNKSLDPKKIGTPKNKILAAR